MFDPENKDHVNRLHNAVRYSRQKMSFIQEERKYITDAYTGPHYTSDNMDRRPIKLLRMAATVYQRQLVPRSPRCLCSTPFLPLKQKADAFQKWADERIESMELEETLRSVVLDAFLKVGIVKVGLCAYGQVEWEGKTHTIGMPYVDPIDLDDFVLDLSVKRFSDVGFAGHKYRIPYDVAMESGYFDRNLDKIAPSAPLQYNEFGTPRVDSLLHWGDWREGEIEDMVDVWEIFLPRSRMVVSFLGEEGSGMSQTILRVSDWHGPKRGPYHILGFMDVPGQPLPAGTAEDLIDLDDIANDLFAKLAEQARRQKSITLVQSSNDDAKNIQESSDGEVRHCDNPEAANEVSMGGPNAINAQFFLQVKSLFEFFGGNIGALAGLGPQSETLGQDQIIQANASKTVQEMQHRTTKFTNGILDSLFFWWWTDAMQEYYTETTYPGTSIVMPRHASTITPEERAGTFLDMNFKLDTYSMQAETPSGKASALMQLWMQVVMPMAGAMQQAGMTPNIEGFLRKMAKYTNITDLEEIIQMATPPTEQPSNGPPSATPQNPPMAPATTRTNVRVNRPGMTEQGADQQMGQMWQNLASRNGTGVNGSVQ